MDPTSSADRDVATAGQLQRMLLPPQSQTIGEWSTALHYEPAGVVSGDYVDVMSSGDRLYFMVGDVSGKGVAASLLMAQLHAMFRTLIPFGLTLDELMTRASALLCASSLPSQYATVVSGFLSPNGHVSISNAGHPPPLVISGGHHREVRATGVPFGMFCESQFSSNSFALGMGDTLLIYTDGLTEGRNDHEEEYGNRVEHAARQVAHLPVTDAVQAVVADQRQFRGGRPNTDDLTVLAIRRR